VCSAFGETPQASRLIQTFVARGYVQHVASHDDASVTLTERGTAAAAIIRGAAAEINTAPWDTLAAGEIDRARRTLAALAEQAQSSAGRDHHAARCQAVNGLRLHPTPTPPTSRSHQTKAPASAWHQTTPLSYRRVYASRRLCTSTGRRPTFPTATLLQRPASVAAASRPRGGGLILVTPRLVVLGSVPKRKDHRVVLPLIEQAQRDTRLLLRQGFDPLVPPRVDAPCSSRRRLAT
jgi:hypothetical protein